MAVIQVPDPQDPNKSYFSLDERFLCFYMWKNGISSNLYWSAIAEIKRNNGFFTRNYMEELQRMTMQSLNPTAPAGYVDGQYNYHSLICEVEIGNEPEPIETFYW